MSETTSNPGTPPDETADAGNTPVSESVEGEVREAAQDEKERMDWKAMALGLKATLEERNRREQEAQTAQPTGGSTSPTEPLMAQAQADMNILRAAYMELQQDAAAGDRRALLNLKLLEDQMQVKQELLYQQQLGVIHDPARRAKVWDHFQKNRHRLNTVDAADLELDGLEYRQSKAELERQKKDAESVIRAKEQGVQGTHGSREVTATEAKVRKMTGEQFDNEIGRLRSEGKDSEARRLMGLVRERKILLTG